jgi:hypothetical protein
MQFTTLKSARLAAVLGFFTAMAFGCVLTVGQGDGKTGTCPEINNHLEGDECFCDSGYSWCEPFDDDDLSCCEIGGNDTSNNTPATPDTTPTTSNGTTTDPPPTSGTSTTQDTEDPPTSGTTSGPPPSNCVVDVSPPASCDPDAGENFLCLTASDADCGPEGSQYYVCEGGTWVESGDADALCQSDGYDFAYGCTVEDSVVQFSCGVGPGTACDSSGAAVCATEQNIEYCVYGKLTASDCLFECMEGGMVQYDYGYCGEQEGDLACICCDEGEDDCPLGGGTSTSSDGSSTGGSEGSSSTG